MVTPAAAAAALLDFGLCFVSVSASLLCSATCCDFAIDFLPHTLGRLFSAAPPMRTVRQLIVFPMGLRAANGRP